MIFRTFENDNKIAIKLTLEEVRIIKWTLKEFAKYLHKSHRDGNPDNITGEFEQTVLNIYNKFPEGKII